MSDTIKIELQEELNQQLKNKLEQIQNDHKDKVEGIYELYDSLYVNGHCESYNKARGFYIAYSLADNGIEFIIE